MYLCFLPTLGTSFMPVYHYGVSVFFNSTSWVSLNQIFIYHFLLVVGSIFMLASISLKCLHFVSLIKMVLHHVHHN